MSADLTAARRPSARDTPITARVRVFIPREPEVVFDYFADLGNEPQYNGQVSEIVKTSPGPVGPNTTFEGSHVGLGRVSWRLSEYNRPTHVVIDGGVGQGRYRWISDFAAAEGGTWMTGQMEWQPPDRWRPLRPLLARILLWNARRSFRRFGRVLQQATKGSTTTSASSPRAK
jgi:hypothetical protein